MHGSFLHLICRHLIRPPSLLHLHTACLWVIYNISAMLTAHEKHIIP